jgi:hypothetical protein
MTPTTSSPLAIGALTNSIRNGGRVTDIYIAQALNLVEQSVNQNSRSTQFQISNIPFPPIPVSTTPPGNVTAIVVTGFIDPNTLAIALQVQVTPPTDPGDTITGCHIYLEVPDQSSGTPVQVGTTDLSGTASLIGPWTPIDCGTFPIGALAARLTIPNIPGPPGINASINIPSRVYANSVSGPIQNTLVEANQPSPTPSQTFTLVSVASGTPANGTNITGLTIASGGLVTIVADALAPVNVTGKLETPVYVQVADTPVIPGWCFQLVLTMAGTDPTLAANQTVLNGGQLYTQAGPVVAPADGISQLTTPHSFVLDTPTAVTNAVVWLVAGLVNASGVFQGNNIVPGITPSFPIVYGSTVGTTDASAIITSTIAASMAIVNGLFGVATAGITNSLLGSGAVATINVQNLAITNPLLASLAVQAANLATGSVTSTAIAAAAVGTAAIQNAAITNALIANLAVSGAQIQSATITGANIASATIGTANIGTGVITNALIATATITGAKIASATITDANITSLSATKLTAGTISATISITSPTITCTNGFEVTAGGLTTTIANAVPTGTFTSNPAGLIVTDGGTVMSIVSVADGLAILDYTGTHMFCQFGWQNVTGGVAGILELGSSVSGAHLIQIQPTSGSGGNPIINIGGQTGFTGTLAAAITAGYSVIAGVIVT